MSGWVAGAVVVAGVGGALIASSGARSAADTQAAAANRSADISQNEFNTMTAQQQPFMQSGYGAQGQLNYLMGIGPNPNAPVTMGRGGGYFPGTGGNTWTGDLGGPSASGPGARLQTGGGDTFGGMPYGGRVNSTYGQGGNQYGAGPGGGAPSSGGSPAGAYGSLLSPFTVDMFHQMSPAYKFQLQQGQQGVLNADASNAGAMSGAAQKDLMGYNQSMADTAFNTAFNQYQTQQGNIYSRLAGIATLGQNAAANTGAQGANLAGQVAQSVSNAGSAQAAGQVGAANAWSGAVGNMGMLPWLMKGSPSSTFTPQTLSADAAAAPNIGGLFGGP